MSQRVTRATIEIGASCDLSLAAGEDRAFQLTYTQGGTPIDFTGAKSVTLFARSPSTGVIVFEKEHDAFVGGAVAGTPQFTFASADTAAFVDTAPLLLEVDASWVDADGWKTQLQLASRLTLLRR